MKTLTRAITAVATFAAVAVANAQSGDGSLDQAMINRAAFEPFSAFGSVARQTDGKLLVGGDFQKVDGLARNGFARLNADGTFDPSFSCPIDQVYAVHAVIVLPDGKIVVGGSFTSIGGIRRYGIARLNTNGSLDQSFDPGASSTYYVNSMALQPDGKIVIGGIYDVTLQASYRNLIARLSPNGSLDDTFRADIGEYNAGVTTIALQSDGKVLAAGTFTGFNGQSRPGMARLNSNGTLDSTFNPGAGGVDYQIYTIAPEADGRIVIGGDFTQVNSSPATRVARLDSNGSIDESFHAVADDSVTKAAVQSDGKVFIAGFFMSVGDGTQQIEQHSIARLNADGSPDTTFAVDIPLGPGGAPVHDFLLLPESQRMLIVGGFEYIDNSTQTSPDLVAVNGIAELRNGAAPPASLANIATRLRIGGGDDGLIAGFIITGQSSATKNVLIRGLGPSVFGVSDQLTDPLLELHDSSGKVVASNDNWQQGDTSKIPTGFAPADPRESVIVATLAAGTSSYTAVLKGAHGETGTGLVEVYDLDGPATAQLANIATRGLSQTGDNVLIAGLIVGGSGSADLLIRAIGPSLTAAGVSGALQDPSLTLVDSNGNQTTNLNWRDDAAQAAKIQDTGAAPTDDREAALRVNLPSGNYTAVVRGEGNTSGVAVVEVYNLR